MMMSWPLRRTFWQLVIGDWLWVLSRREGMIMQKLQYFTSYFHSLFCKSVQNYKKYLDYRLNLSQKMPKNDFFDPILCFCMKRLPSADLNFSGIHFEYNSAYISFWRFLTVPQYTRGRGQLVIANTPIANSPLPRQNWLATKNSLGSLGLPPFFLLNQNCIYTILI